MHLNRLNRFRNVQFPSIIRMYTNGTQLDNLQKIRNIGILAHIDAGKTTTTERMLFYSGVIQQMGEVHHGNTVTDHMVQERERGITITSAAVTFNWKKHQFNLIDTPGHIDFTMEVEQTLNVLDGAVVILDGSAGVEAQTLTVWRQADRYKIPRIIFLNKMDRGDADYEMCLRSIGNKLEVTPLLLQIPLVINGKLTGLLDVLSLEKLVWNLGSTSKQITISDVTEKKDLKLWEQLQEYRLQIIDKLSEFNDALADMIIASGSMNEIKSTDVICALRKATLDQKVVPVLCGSAYKNIGMEPLMDAVALYLPSPIDQNKQFRVFENNLCAQAFKIIHNKQRGPLVYFRIYSGCLTKGQRMYNIQQEKTEQIGKLYVAYADDLQEVETISEGNIAVVGGLKQTLTGDLVTTSTTVAERTKTKLIKLNKDVGRIFSKGAKIPEPVFFCSIEPPSLAYQSALEQALIELQREDSSLKVTYDTETGQTILGGMGELHLEIIKDRILREYKVAADLGPLQIAYRESPIKQVTGDLVIATNIGNSKQSVTVKLSVMPNSDDKEVLQFDKTSDSASNIASIFSKHLAAIRQGVNVALTRGPKISSQIVNIQIMLHHFEVGRGTSETIIAATVTQCIHKLLVEAGTKILEPIMNLEIVVPEEYFSVVLADLSRRRASIENVTFRNKNKVIVCETPLAELLGYSTMLRTITSGTATFAMEFSEYQVMSSVEELKTMEFLRGY